MLHVLCNILFLVLYENHAIVAWFRKAYGYEKRLPM